MTNEFTDGVIRRMIDKWLKAGAVEDGLLRRTTEGSPQGGVISPCLSNVFLHHVLDEWFETEVRPRLKGECTLVRFADDAVMAFDNIVDAQRVLAVLGKRLARYGLTLHPDKTRIVDFRPQRLEGARHPETDGTSFDFLGLTHVWGRSRNGKNMVRQMTAKSRFARAVAAVNDWCRKHRHWSIRDQHRHLSSMMRGHFAYYGVGGNSRRLRWFANQVGRIWRKWLSRRDRQGVVTMDPLQRNPDTPPAASSQDPPWLRRRERTSLVKNRMREICTSGSVRDGGGNAPIYSAFGAMKRCQVTPERSGFMKVTVHREEVQFPCSEGLRQMVQEQASEHPRQHPDRQEEPWTARDPGSAIWRDAATRDQAVEMRIYAVRTVMPSQRRDC